MVVKKSSNSLQQRRQDIIMEDKVTAFWAITGNVSQCPNGLFLNVLELRRKQTNKNRHCASVYHHSGLVRSTRRYVCQRPCGLKLQCGIIFSLQELDKFGYYSSRDYFVDRWIWFCCKTQTLDARPRNRTCFLLPLDSNFLNFCVATSCCSVSLA